MDDIDREIINRYQGDFPVVDRPFQVLGEALGIDESEVMHRVQAMLDDGRLTRFGPLYNIDRMGGIFSLCAMQVPEQDFEQVAEQVNALQEVAHNYARNHRLNMWFVVAAESESALHDTLQRLEHATGLKVYKFPNQKEFFVKFRPRA